MKLVWKIIIGLATAFVVIVRFVSYAAYFGWFFSYFSEIMRNPYGTNPPSIAILPISFFMCFSTILQFILQGFYIVHNISNRSGSDVVRAVLGMGMLFLPYITLPIYYFIYILPSKPPKWAQAQPTSQELATTQPVA